MSEMCLWLHEQLEQIHLIRYPFNLNQLPENGIYFLYEEGETLGNNVNKLRIVRIGTHRKDGNFRNRIAEHYLIDKSKMDFDKNKPAPKDRSIFRKQIGSAILHKQNNDYLDTWKIDFTYQENREKYGNERDIPKEIYLENEITKILREKCSFRFIIMDDKSRRKCLEKSFIGTVAYCSTGKPSGQWQGNFHPDKKIKESGLWQVQHLKAKELTEKDKSIVTQAIIDTKNWILKNP